MKTEEMKRRNEIFDDRGNGQKTRIKSEHKTTSTL
jgi:hypothetical protein